MIRNMLNTIIFLYISIVFVNAQFNQFVTADTYIKQGNYQAAISTLNNYIELNPASAEAYIKRATAHQFLGQIAERDFDLSLAKYLNPFANMYISMTARFKYFEKKQYEYDFERPSSGFIKSPVNTKYYSKYIQEIDGIHSQDSLLREAIFYLSKSDIKNTEVTLSQILETKNNTGIINDIKGLILLKKNMVPESITYFTRSIDASPKFALAYHNRAIAYKQLNQLDKARKDLKTAIDLNEDMSVFYFTLAKLNELSGEEQKTNLNYSKAIDRNPDYIEARNNYSLIQKTLGNYEESLAGLNNILSEESDEIENHFIKGGIALTYGEYETSIQEFSDYLEYHDQDSKAIFNMGLAKVLLGDKSEGCQDISESISIQQEDKREEIYEAFCSSL